MALEINFCLRFDNINEFNQILRQNNAYVEESSLNVFISVSLLPLPFR